MQIMLQKNSSAAMFHRPPDGSERVCEKRRAVWSAGVISSHWRDETI